MMKKLTAFILSLALLFSVISPLSTVTMATGNNVTVWLDGEAVSSVSVPEDEERVLTATVSDIFPDGYHWQIKITNADIWVNIDGYTSPECAVSYALVGSMLDGSNTAYLRLKVTSGGAEFTSDPVAVVITPPVPEEVEEPEAVSIDEFVEDEEYNTYSGPELENFPEMMMVIESSEDDPSEPTEAASEPTEAASEPTEAASEPTEAASEPTEAASEPTEAPSEPTEAASEPTEAASEPTEAASEPTEAVAPITEPEIEETQAPPTEEPGESMPGSGEDGSDYTATPAAYTGKGYSVVLLADEGSTIDDEPTVMTYDVSFFANGGEWVDGSDVGDYTLTGPEGAYTRAFKYLAEGQVIVAPTTQPTREGYTFRGWFDAAGNLVDFTTPQTMAARGVIYYAKWQANEGNSLPIRTIRVDYLYSLDNTQVEAPYLASIRQGESFTIDLRVPYAPGFVPYFDKNRNGNYEAEEALVPESDGAGNTLGYTFHVVLDNIQTNYTFVVRYFPTERNYQVNHYFQSGSNYVLKETETHTGMTGTLVPDNLYLTDTTGAQGYTHLEYGRVAIAADGTTQINIYYQINYYMVDFMLNPGEMSGAYGVEPVYAAYGSTVSFGDPTAPGYSFTGWELIGYGGEAGNYDSPSQELKNQYHLTRNTTGSYTVIVPAANLQFMAKWDKKTVHYTVVYWRERETAYGYTGPTLYEFWGQQEVRGVEPGDPVDLSQYRAVPQDIATTTAGLNETPFFHYNQTKTEGSQDKPITYTVAGDSSTVVNIYFDRNTYNLKFYYAASQVKNGNTVYQVLGGSTYGFGASATYGYTDRDEVLFGRVLSEENDAAGKTPTGQVEEMPSLNENGQGKNYTTGTAEYTSNSGYGTKYTLYYIAFQAKYGMDISSMWPTDVFNSVTRTSGNYNNSNDHGEWKSMEAFVSAWNGEYNVKYSQDHNGQDGKDDNQTIKGKYDKLDTNILWDLNIVSTYADESEKKLGGLTSDGGTVAYVCFWENGAQVNWNVPELYRYNIWLECLNQTAPPEGAVKFNGTDKWYYLSERYNTVDDSDVDHQTTPPVYGFNNVGKYSSPLTKETDYDSSLYAEGWDVHFYYNRNTYELRFHNQGEDLGLLDADGNEMTGVTKIRYGVSLYSEESRNDLNNVTNDDGTLKYYPKSLPKGGYRFEGWYTSPTFAASTKFLFDKDDTMPAYPLVLYANWVPVEFKVRIYLDYDAMTAPNSKTLWHATDGRDYTLVAYEENAPSPSGNYPEFQEKTQKGYVLEGWFYRDEDGTEHAWNFESSRVTQDMNIYGKWTSNNVRPYTVYYLLEDTKTPVAEPTTGYALAGSTVTMTAKAGDELNEGYTDHYFLVTGEDNATSHTMEITMEGTNEYTFYYKKANAVPYTVRYVDGEGKQLADPKTVSENYYSVVTEVFKPVAGYVPNAFSQRLILDASETGGENNVITFVYTSSETEAAYEIVHYIQNIDNDEYSEHESIQAIGSIQSTITAKVLDLTGFTFAAAETKATNAAGNQVDYTYNSAATPGTVTAVLDANGLRIELYYDRNVLSYTVDYLEYHENTGADAKSLKPTKNVADIRYGKQVSEKAEKIVGYELLANTQDVQTPLITDDGQKIEFYYTEASVVIDYKAVTRGKDHPANTVTTNQNPILMLNGEPQGSEPAPDTGYRFVGWYRDENCTDPVDQGWVSGNKLTPQKEAFSATDNTQVFKAATYYALFERETGDLTVSVSGSDTTLEPNQTFVFRITNETEGVDLTVTVHNNGSTTVTGLPTGTYTVTELGSSAWRYSSDVSKSADVTANATANAPFAESRTQIYWLDGNAAQTVNKFTGGGE